MSEKIKVMYVGSELYAHPSHRIYIERQIRERGLRISEICQCSAMDPKLPGLLQNILSSEEDLLIFARSETSALISELLCRLNGDTLRMDGELVVPSRIQDLLHKSYLYEINGRRVNVVVSEVGEELSPLLLEPIGKKVLHLFLEEEKLPPTLEKILWKENRTLERVQILPGWLRLELYGEENIGRLESELAPWFARTIPGDSLVESLIHYLASIGKKITFAESCTGGLLAATFTSEPGASEILEGSYVTYSNRIKAGWLGVREETLREFGAVSRECVLEMAEGAQRNLEADIAIAVSGIAGPTGAVPGKPVGTVWVCLRNGKEVRTERLQLQGDRNAVQDQTLLYALKFLVASEENKIFDFFSKIP
ncbi:CinA family protein [Nitratifractor sp.]